MSNPQSPFQLHYPVFAESMSDQVRTLLDFISLRFAKHSTAELVGWIEEGRIMLNGHPCAPTDLLAPQDAVSIHFPGHAEDLTDCNWHIVWENNEIMAVYKPHLLPVSRTTRNLYNTLIQLVRRQTPYYDAHLLHRLDTETAGLILIAKDKAADLKWKKQLHCLIERKLYHAEVTGTPIWQHNVLECELAAREHSAIRSQAHVVEETARHQFIKPKWSKTAFRVIERGAGRSLIECELYTGRKHQIRAHLAWLGHPIIGDKIYSHAGHFYLKRLEGPLSDEDFSTLGAPHHKLTAVELVIRPEPLAEPVKISLHPSGVPPRLYKS